MAPPFFACATCVVTGDLCVSCPLPWKWTLKALFSIHSHHANLYFPSELSFQKLFTTTCVQSSHASAWTSSQCGVTLRGQRCIKQLPFALVHYILPIWWSFEIAVQTWGQRCSWTAHLCRLGKTWAVTSRCFSTFVVLCSALVSISLAEGGASVELIIRTCDISTRKFVRQGTRLYKKALTLSGWYPSSKKLTDIHGGEQNSHDR